MADNGPGMTGQAQWQPGGASPPPLADTLARSPCKARPGRAWYLLALAVFLAGAAWLVSGISASAATAATSCTTRRQGPRPGSSRPLPSRWHPQRLPRARSLQPYTADMTYTFGSRQGRAVLTVQVAHPGTFRVVATGAPAVEGGSDLAVGPGIAGGIARAALPAVLLMLLGAAGGLALFIIRYLRSARRRARTGAPLTDPGPHRR